jgi:RHS repeat-associated protein
MEFDNAIAYLRPMKNRLHIMLLFCLTAVSHVAARPDIAHPDHLGSLAVITSSSGTVVQKCAFDAWGRRQFLVKDPTLVFHCGFTGHEHRDEFGLINMNGRMYDPVLGRFLSPDPFVQMPDFSQSFNRYSYCLNNPLKYTDPSGNFIWFPVISRCCNW